MRSYTILLLAVLLPAGCGKSNDSGPPGEKSVPAAVSTESAAKTPSSGGYVDMMLKTRHDAKDLVALEPIRQAIRSFEAENGRYPADLDELRKASPELSEVMKDNKYDYNAKTGEIKQAE